jgi:predicted RNA-binding Zn-ribbon protein involved in translation (DUF1610 family)
MRLIDANALRERMFSYYGCVNEKSSKEYYRGETLMNYEVADMIEDCIDNAPTVDAVEVKHGRWTINTDDFTPAYRCSVCGYNKPMIAGERVSQGAMNYCPNCGAKMDGERKDNE